MDMEYEGKPSNSETSSEENDQPAEKFTDENTSAGRFYECIFCKRGFTNAQALGGHMNIHRKDKAKAKQKVRKSSVTSKSSEEVMSSRNYERLSTEQPQYYAVPTESQMNNYQFFFPGSNPNVSQGYDHLGGFAAPRQECLSLYGDHHEGLNLSMHIDHYHHENMSKSYGNNTWEEEDEVDLELRLG
ncbi:uncharacterized protein [Coffea arabica]|uniref:C2H2-type domain-containing protein n=1 Tax=Coffea arabica TaxID=13443 RepID=A0A6P6UAX5_COFAR